MDGMYAAAVAPSRGALIGLLDLLVRRRAREVEPERHLAADAVRGRVVDSLRHRDARVVVQALRLAQHFIASLCRVRVWAGRGSCQKT